MQQRDPSGAFRRFRQLAAERLGTVLRDYQFIEADANVIDPGMWVLFRNSTTELQAHFEYMSGVWFVLNRLATFGGKTVGGEGYSLNELLLLRAPEKADQAEIYDFDEKAIASLITEAAGALRDYADDVLRGDFTVFPQLAQMRAARPAPDMEIL